MQMRTGMNSRCPDVDADIGRDRRAVFSNAFVSICCGRTDKTSLSKCCSTVAHHQRGGRMMTQTQEEMILIGAFGLFWLCTSSPSSHLRKALTQRLPSYPSFTQTNTAVLVALRAFGTRGDVAADPLMNMYTASGLGLSRTPAPPAPTAVERRTVTIDRGGLFMGGESGLGPGRPHANAAGAPAHQLGPGGGIPQGAGAGWPCSGEAVRCVVEEWRYI